MGLICNVMGNRAFLLFFALVTEITSNTCQNSKATSWLELSNCSMTSLPSSSCLQRIELWNVPILYYLNSKIDELAVYSKGQNCDELASVVARKCDLNRIPSLLNWKLVLLGCTLQNWKGVNLGKFDWKKSSSLAAQVFQMQHTNILDDSLKTCYVNFKCFPLPLTELVLRFSNTTLIFGSDLPKLSYRMTVLEITGMNLTDAWFNSDSVRLWFANVYFIRKLILADNKLQSLPAIGPIDVHVLDLSANEIRSVTASQLFGPSLTEVYLWGNRILSLSNEPSLMLHVQLVQLDALRDEQQGDAIDKETWFLSSNISSNQNDTMKKELNRTVLCEIFRLVSLLANDLIAHLPLSSYTLLAVTCALVVFNFAVAFLVGAFFGRLYYRSGRTATKAKTENGKCRNEAAQVATCQLVESSTYSSIYNVIDCPYSAVDSGEPVMLMTLKTANHSLAEVYAQAGEPQKSVYASV